MKKTTISKISRPNAKGIIPRKRLFRLLDSAKKHPVLWIAGPAGSGKTSLIASYLDARKIPCLWYQADDRDSDIASFFYYLGLAAQKAAPRYRKPLPLLTPEYLRGIATFTRRFFENIYSRLKPPFAVVFDNYQDVPEGSPFHGVIQSGLAQIPAGIRVIVLSRNEPPAALMRERANDSMYVVGWNELRFTLEESKKIILLKKKQKLDEDILLKLAEKAEGWAAGLVLLTQGAGTNGLDRQSGDNPARQEVFDYFAGEVLDKLDTETHNFLVMSSLLPQMTVRSAMKLTGRVNAGRILAALNRNHFFTEKHTAPELTYQYHSLFRAFLQARLVETVSRESVTSLRQEAAGLLLEDGRIEEAAGLLSLAEDWNGLVALILNNARTLIVQGRSRTLREWIEKIPAKPRSENPWLLFWSGLCGAPFDPAGSRGVFEQALRLFQTGADEAGSLLSWSAIVQTILIEFHDFKPLDRLIDWINERSGQGAPLTSPDIEANVVAGMTGILAWRKPDLPDKKKWLDRALSLPRNPGTADVRIRAYTNSAIYHIWMGEFSQCRFLIHEMRNMVQAHSPSPLRRIILKLTEAMLYNSQAGCHEQAARAVAEGLNLSQETGVSLMSPSLLVQGAMDSLNQGDAKGAWEFLGKMERMVGEDRRVNLSHYFFMAAWCELFAGNAARAVDFSQRSLHLIEMAGAPTNETLIRLALAHSLYESGDYSGTRAQLDTINDLVRQSGSSFAGYLYHLTEAYCALHAGDRSQGLNHLGRAIETGRRNDFATMLYFWRPSVLSSLCAEALEAGIEVEYVQSLVRKLKLFPNEGAREVETWPWPLRIVTLGKFNLMRDGKQLGFTRKVQHKPLMLLKALIALGGSEVPEEKITDLLWPDSEGDAAHSAFSTTLQRLRALIGNEKVLLLQERQLSLDRRLCSVDAWFFEGIHGQAEALWRSANGKNGREREHVAAEAYRYGEKALELYQGYFLPGDTDQAWTAPYRERLRNKFLRLVLQQGIYLEESAEWRKAVGTFELGLETDELAEEFYQHLMTCYGKLGQRAEAIMTYKRCRAVLSSSLGIAPSAKTESIYSSLLP